MVVWLLSDLHLVRMAMRWLSLTYRVALNVLYGITLMFDRTGRSLRIGI